MGQKQIKKYRRTIKRNQRKIIRDFISAIKEWKFTDRLKLAWKIIRKK